MTAPSKDIQAVRREKEGKLLGNGVWSVDVQDGRFLIGTDSTLTPERKDEIRRMLDGYEVVFHEEGPFEAYPTASGAAASPRPKPERPTAAPESHTSTPRRRTSGLRQFDR